MRLRIALVLSGNRFHLLLVGVEAVRVVDDDELDLRHLLDINKNDLVVLDPGLPRSLLIAPRAATTTINSERSEIVSLTART